MYMAISTKGIGAMDISNVSSASKSKTGNDKKDATGSFADLMNITSGNNAVETPGDKAVSKKSDTEDSNYNTEFKQKNSPADDGRNKVKSDDRDTDINSSKKVSKNEESVEGKSDDSLNETDIKETLATEIIQKIKELIEDKLGMDDEELKANLERLGLNYSDLLNPEKIQDFVLDSEDSTKLDMLVNEDLNALVSQIVEGVQEIADYYSVDENMLVFIDNNISEITDKIDSLADLQISADEDTGFIPQMTADDSAEISDTDTAVVNNNNSEKNAPVKDTKVTESEIQTKETDNVKVTVDVSDEAKSGTGQNSKSEKEFGNDILNNLNRAVDMVSDLTDTNVVSDFADDIQRTDIVRQVVDEIKANLSHEVKSLELQLNPEHLGRVQITVSTRNGVMQAQIVAENEAAKSAIENGIAALKEAFENQDLKVEAVEVTIASYEFFGSKEQNEEFEQQNQNKSSNVANSIDLNDDIIEEELSEAEKIEISIMKSQGNSVSYSI